MVEAKRIERGDGKRPLKCPTEVGHVCWRELLAECLERGLNLLLVGDQFKVPPGHGAFEIGGELVRGGDDIREGAHPAAGIRLDGVDLATFLRAVEIEFPVDADGRDREAVGALGRHEAHGGGLGAGEDGERLLAREFAVLPAQRNFRDEEFPHLDGQEVGGVEVGEVAPLELDPVLLRRGGRALREEEAVDEVDLGMGLPVLLELVLDDAEKGPRRRGDAHLLLDLAHKGLLTRFAELDVSAGKVGGGASFGPAEQDFAVLDADAAGDRLDARQFIFWEFHSDG